MESAVNDQLNRLAQRLRELKGKWSRWFDMWRRAKLAENEVISAHYAAAREKRNRELAEAALAVAQRTDPLAEALLLLDEANQILSSPTRNSYEARSWLAEHMAFKSRRHRANYQS